MYRLRCSRHKIGQDQTKAHVKWRQPAKVGGARRNLGICKVRLFDLEFSSVGASTRSFRAHLAQDRSNIQSFKQSLKTMQRSLASRARASALPSLSNTGSLSRIRPAAAAGLNVQQQRFAHKVKSLFSELLFHQSLIDTRISNSVWTHELPYSKVLTPFPRPLRQLSDPKGEMYSSSQATAHLR